MPAHGVLPGMLVQATAEWLFERLMVPENLCTKRVAGPHHGILHITTRGNTVRGLMRLGPPS